MKFVFLGILFLAVYTNIDRPIIGILSQPTTSKLGHSYIASSYIKYVESAGGRVVPILYDYSEEKLKDLFSKVNGVLFPGGGVPLVFTNPYMKTQKLFYDLSIQDENDFFPIWGTCLGFQSLVIITSLDEKILSSGYQTENISLPLLFDVDPMKDSRIFKDFPSSIVDMYKNEKVTANNHHCGITINTFNKTKKLTDFYTMISHNDYKGKDFVSTIESKKYPIYGSQWHPEKPMFEDRPTGISHTYHSVQANLITNLFFVNECRKSTHRFPSQEEEQKYLIYNYNTVYTGVEGSEFDTIYFFPKAR